MAIEFLQRCAWCAGNDLMIRYHDEEWGVPVHDDRLLFEFLILEGAQAGLSWLTILKRRETHRRAFDGFDPKHVATYGETKIAALLKDSGIIRNRLKVHAAVRNARAFLAIQEEFGSFDQYLWEFVGGKPVVNHPRTSADIPASTPLSGRLSKDLKRRGFGFVGTTICYAFLQAVGVVDDHVVGCHRAGR